MEAAINYYEHHIGDYAQATAHLSFVEDAAYSRLIRKYYAEEKPLPADLKAVQRLVGARTKEERQAVSDILDEFFELEADGWHNKRCDAEIARYRGKQDKARASAEARWSKRNAPAMRTHAETDANASTGNDANAMRTHSETDADAMRTHEPVSSENKKKSSEQHEPEKNKFSGDAASREEKPNKSTGDAMRTQCEGNAHQSPSTRHQTPDSEQASSVVQPLAAAADPIHSRAIELSVLLRQRGAALQASDPRVRTWAEVGISDAQALAALEAAQQRRHEQGNHQPINAGYLDAIIKSTTTPAAQQPNRRRSIHDERADTIAALTGRNRQPEAPGRIIDITPTAADRVD